VQNKKIEENFFWKKGIKSCRGVENPKFFYMRKVFLAFGVKNSVFKLNMAIGMVSGLKS
jgi:hypothetical protein